MAIKPIIGSASRNFSIISRGNGDLKNTEASLKPPVSGLLGDDCELSAGSTVFDFRLGCDCDCIIVTHNFKLILDCFHVAVVLSDYTMFTPSITPLPRLFFSDMLLGLMGDSLTKK